MMFAKLKWPLAVAFSIGTVAWAILPAFKDVLDPVYIADVQGNLAAIGASILAVLMPILAVDKDKDGIPDVLE